jgi:hypothetical protein
MIGGNFALLPTTHQKLNINSLIDQFNILIINRGDILSFNLTNA